MGGVLKWMGLWRPFQPKTVFTFPGKTILGLLHVTALQLAKLSYNLPI